MQLKMKILIIIFAVFISVKALCQKDLIAKVDKIAKNLLMYGHDNDNLTIKTLQNIPLARKRHLAMCESCNVVVTYILEYRKSDASRDAMINYLKNLCYKFMDWSKTYCDGRIENEIDAILYIIDNGESITSKRVCSIQLVHMNCSDPDALKWEIPLSPYESFKPSGKVDAGTLTFHAFSDIHYDPGYHAEKNAICDEPVCCQYGDTNNKSNQAGFWADPHKCELPWRTVREFIKQVASQTTSAYFFTGDIITQSSWKSSQENVKYSMRIFYKLVNSFSWQASFLPVLGDFDTHPVGHFPPKEIVDPDLSIEWLFELLAEHWFTYLNNSGDAYQTILAGAYYTIKLPSSIQIIVLNNNVCLNKNLWLIYDDVDPYNQLEWLAETLESFEKSKSKAYILQHVPIGHVHCHKQWSDQYARILKRYMFTVASVIYGHIHYDTIHLLLHPTDSLQALNGISAGSLTAYGGKNPMFKKLMTNRVTRIIYDSFPVYLNITATNNNLIQRPSFFTKNNFEEVYSTRMDKLKQFNSLHYQLHHKFSSLDQKFYRMYVTYYDHPPDCDYTCKKTLACMSLVMTTEDAIRCQYYP